MGWGREGGRRIGWERTSMPYGLRGIDAPVCRGKPGKFPVTGFTLPWHRAKKNLSRWVGWKVIFPHHWLSYDLPVRRMSVKETSLKKQDLVYISVYE